MYVQYVIYSKLYSNSLKINVRAQTKIVMEKHVITQETSYKLKENIINISLLACNIFRMRIK